MCLHRGWLFTFIFSPQSCDLRNALLIEFFFCVSLSLPGNSVRFLQKRPCNTTTGTKKLHPKSLAGSCRLLSLTVSWGQRGFMLPASLSSASRNADDPEVRLQQQFQLHRPPHFRFHALPAEDGEGAPEPATQPRNRWNQHRWPFFRHLGQGGFFFFLLVICHNLLFYFTLLYFILFVFLLQLLITLIFKKNYMLQPACRKQKIISQRGPVQTLITGCHDQ